MGVSSDPFCLTMGRYAEFWHRLEKSLITLWTFSLWCEIVQRNLLTNKSEIEYMYIYVESRMYHSEVKGCTNTHFEVTLINVDLKTTVRWRSDIMHCSFSLPLFLVLVRFSCLFVWWCLTPPLTIFQLYSGGQFYWWRKSEDPEKTIVVLQVTYKLYHIMLYTSPWSRFELTTSVMVGTDCIGSCKSNYHTITATTVPVRFSIEFTSWCLTYMYNVLTHEAFEALVFSDQKHVSNCQQGNYTVH